MEHVADHLNVHMHRCYAHPGYVCILYHNSSIIIAARRRPLTHIYSELLEDNNIDALHTLGVLPISNQFWQYPHCNVYQHWQADILHQLLLDLVKD